MLNSVILNLKFYYNNNIENKAIEKEPVKNEEKTEDLYE